MIKFSLSAVSAIALLGLTACGDTVEEGDTTVVATEPADTGAYDAPAPESDVDAETADSVTISEDGVTADISGGDVSVNADADGKPSAKIVVN